MNSIIVKCKIDEGAFMPVKAYEADAGFDIRTPMSVVIPAHGNAVIDTGVHFDIPDGYCGVLKSKSGLSVKFSLRTAAGVIDSGYIGSVRVNMFNDSDNDYQFNAGDKLAQIMFLPVPNIKLVLTEVIRGETPRGDNGFGSTGR